MEGQCVASVSMLVPILSLSMGPHDILWAAAAPALARLCGDLKAEDLLSPFNLMWVFKKLNLS